MNISAPTRFGLVMALGVLAGGLSSCQDRDFGLAIVQVQPVDTGNCEVTLDRAQFQSDGVVDLAMRTSYQIRPLVENKMLSINEVKAFSANDGRVDTNDIVLRSATIEYTTLDVLSAQITSPAVVPISGTVPVNGEVVIGVEVLNAEVMTQLRDADEFLLIDQNGQARPKRSTISIIARVRLEGETLDGKSVESNEFLFPIQICNGCQIAYPPGVLEVRNGVLTCPAVSLDAEGNPVPPVEIDGTCPGLIGTDGFITDCQTCQGIAVNSFARQLCQPPTGD